MANNFSKKVAKKTAAKDIPSQASIAALLEDTDNEEVVIEAKTTGRFLEIDPKKCVPDPNQPRKTFTEEGLLSLRTSIEMRGQLKPVLVGNPLDDGTYPIISGERRWRAISQSDTVKTIDIVISKRAIEDVNAYKDAVFLLTTQLDENDEVEPVPIVEKARAIKTCVDILTDKGLNQSEIATALNMSKAKLSKHLSLLKAPESIQELSEGNKVQDLEVLNNLSKVSASNPEAVDKLIDDWEAGELETNLRKASNELAQEVKEEAGSKSQKDKSRKKAEKLADIFGLEIEEVGDHFEVTFMIGKKANTKFKCSVTALENMKNTIGKFWKE